jgi:hypothetical protein
MPKPVRSYFWVVILSRTDQSCVRRGITEAQLHVRAEGEQAAIAILHHKLTRVPWRIGKFPRKFHASGGVLSVERVGIFDEHIGVEQFVRILVWIGCGRRGAAEMNRVLVARNDGVLRRILPRTQTLEAKLRLVIRKGPGYVQSEELRRDPTNHGIPLRIAPKIIEDTNEVAIEIGGHKLAQLPEFVLGFGNDFGVRGFPLREEFVYLSLAGEIDPEKYRACVAVGLSEGMVGDEQSAIPL